MFISSSHITFQNWSSFSVVLPQGITTTLGTDMDSCRVDAIPCSLFSVER